MFRFKLYRTLKNICPHQHSCTTTATTSWTKGGQTYLQLITHLYAFINSPI